MFKTLSTLILFIVMVNGAEYIGPKSRSVASIKEVHICEYNIRTNDIYKCKQIK